MADNTLRFTRAPISGDRSPLDLFHSEAGLDLFPSEAEQGRRAELLASTPDEPLRADAPRPSSAPRVAAESVVTRWKRWLASLILLPSLATAIWLRVPLPSSVAIGAGSTNAGTVQPAAAAILHPRDVILETDAPEASRLLEEWPVMENAPAAEIPTAAPVALAATVPAASRKVRVKPHALTTPSTSTSSSTAPSLSVDSAGSPGEAVRPAAASVGNSSLERFKFLGSIVLESQPAGAQVFVDGEPVGITPLGKWDMPAGSHVIRVELDGYTRWSAAVQIITAKTLNVIANLQPVAHR